MGITIHYQLRLSDRAALPPLLAAAREFATARGWPVHDIAESNAERYRIVESRAWDYTGPISGMLVIPDEFCEPVALEFGTDLIACAATKTAYAGAEVHEEVVALLDALASHVETMEVHDETEFWETRDPAALRRRLSTRDELRSERLDRIFSGQRWPGRRGPAADPS